MGMVEFDKHDASTWQDQDISDILDLLTHDVNNINQSIRGYTMLMRAKLQRDGEIDPEMLEKVIDIILNRTEELTHLMRSTALHSKSLRP